MLRESDPSHIAAGMALDIRERFLHDAKQGQLHFRGQAAELIWCIEIDGNSAALGKSRRKPAQSRQKTEFIEQRRMKKIGNRAHLLHALFKRIGALEQQSAVLFAQRSASRFKISKLIFMLVRYWPRLSCSSRLIWRRSSSCKRMRREERARTRSSARLRLVMSFITPPSSGFRPGCSMRSAAA